MGLLAIPLVDLKRIPESAVNKNSSSIAANETWLGNLNTKTFPVLCQIAQEKVCLFENRLTMGLLIKKGLKHKVLVYEGSTVHEAGFATTTHPILVHRL